MAKTVLASGPNLINFQGKVVNADGTNVANGTYNFDFVLYDDASLGTPSDGVHDKWHELSKSITVTNGVFQTELGSATTLPDFNANTTLYLAIKFNGDAQGYMSPRIHLDSVPYARNADAVGGLASSQLARVDALSTFAAGLTVTAGQNFTVNSDVFTDLTGLGLKVSSAALSLDESSALSGDFSLSANQEQFGQSGIIFEGSTADTIEGYLAFADQTGADHTFTFPNVSSGNVCISTISCTATAVANDSVALTTGTTGNYVLDITAGNGLTGDTAGEGVTASLAVGAGNGISVAADSVAVSLAAASTTATTSSGSGLEFNSGLTMLQGCSDTQVLKWNGTTHVWACASSSASIAADSLNFTDFSDAMTLDASTSIGFGASNFGLTFNDDGSGDFTVNLKPSGVGSGNFVVKSNTTQLIKVTSGGVVDIGDPSSSGPISIDTGSSSGALTLAGHDSASLASSAGSVSISSGTTGSFTTGSGNLTLQAGSGTVTLGSSTNLINSGANLTITSNGGSDVVLASNVTLRPGTDSSTGLVVSNAAGTSNILAVNTSQGGVSVFGTESDITRTSTGTGSGSTDFNVDSLPTGSTGTHSTGTNLDNSNDQIELKDGTPATDGCTSCGSINTTGPALNANTGAGAQTISRADGKYVTLNGGGTLTTSLYDPNANSFSAGPAVVLGASCTGNIGVGSLVLPRPGGMYVIAAGSSACAVTGTSNYDPTGTVGSTAGPSLAIALVNNLGNQAFKRPDGRYLITTGGAATSQLYDPVANVFTTTGISATTGTWSTGALVIPRPDGQALIIEGGSTSITQIYNPNNGAAVAFSGGTSGFAGSFSLGPSLDGNQAANTCGINGTGSVAIKKQDGTFIILSKANVYAIYDPVFNNMTCHASGGPSVAMAADAQAIPLQNGHFLIIPGGSGTAVLDYNQNGDTFSSHTTTVTAGSASNAGRHAFMRNDGKWILVTGNGGQDTDIFDSSFPMIDSGGSNTYKTNDIYTTSLGQSSVLRWTAQLETAYAGTSNASTNTAEAPIQFLVRTAKQSASDCTAPLNSATDHEIRSSGDLIRPNQGDNCIRITATFTRPLPKRLVDDRGVWFGAGNTITRLDIATPTLFDLSIDNSVAVRRTSFDFTNTTDYGNPTAPTATESAGSGSCTAGTHVYAVTFVTNGTESQIGPGSNSVTCAGGTDKVVLTNIPLGPTGTTSRKIYRTLVNTTAPFLLVGGGSPTCVLNDNTSTTCTDTLADASLGAQYSADNASVPTLTKAEGTRVEALNGQLTLPYGRITPTTLNGTQGFYQGVITGAHPNICTATTEGTVAMQRDDRQFMILSAAAANACLYDPATQTFTAQSSAGNIPTGTIGAGAFAIKRPDGKFFIILGTGSTSGNCATSGTATNIYDPNASSGNRFTNGPCLTAAAGLGAQALLNTDGTYTLIHGGGLTSSSIYNPVKNTMIAGPTTTTAVNCGSWAIPMQQPFNNQYKMWAGVAAAATGVATGVMNYDANSKVFTAGTNLTSANGCGAMVFQRSDGYWFNVPGASGATGAVGTATNVINPYDGATSAGPAFPAAGVGRGSVVIPRPDGTYLITTGANATTTAIYLPWGGAPGTSGGQQGLGGAGTGTLAAGPALVTASAQGALTFQRPDGKFVLINGSTTTSNVTQLIDTGWYSDGQYLSEQMNVPALAANSTMDWQQTSDQFIRMEVKAASSQAALATASAVSIGRPGQSINNAGGETWVQVEINFRRDFPTYCGARAYVYNSGGGYENCYNPPSLPTLNSFTLSNGSDLLNLQADGLSAFRVTNNGNVYTSPQGGFYTGGADLAERYSSTQGLEAGDVVVGDASKDASVLRSTMPYQTNIMGVVSTAPGFVAGSYTEDSHPIALVGRVPVKVSTENGPIKAGDYLTSGSIPGYAMRAKQAGRVIGQALTPLDKSKAGDCPPVGNGVKPGVKCGIINVFVNLTNYQGDSVETAMADEATTTNTTGLANADNSSGDSTPAILNWSGTTMDGGNDVAQIAYNQQMQHSQDILAFLRQLHASNQGNESQIFAGQISASDRVISPQIITDELIAKKIRADQIEGLSLIVDQVSAHQTSTTSNSPAQVSTNPGLKGSVDFSSSPASFKDLKAINLVVLADIEAKGGLVIEKDAHFNGKTFFQLLAEFNGGAAFHGKVSFDQQPTFNSDAGGQAVINKGDRRVHINFIQPYDQAPIVVANWALKDIKDASGKIIDPVSNQQDRLVDSGLNFLVSNVTKDGFDIITNKPAAEDWTLSWLATAINNAKTTTSASGN